jgi:hypothetical protein
MRIVFTVLIIILIVLLFVVLVINHKRQFYEEKIYTQQNKIYQCNDKFETKAKSDPLSSPFKEIIESHGFELCDNFNEANIILFSDFSLIDQNIKSVKFNSKLQPYYVYGICGSDEMANKALLADCVKHNCKDYTKYIPKSYILHSEEDIEILKKEHDDSKIYIIKKNIQRQEGNMITRDIDYITMQATKDEYVVCQELLQNPYLVNKRKINMRVYMLVIVADNKSSFYIYNNGFMYYTPKYFSKNSLEKDVNITTGYIDRKVYKENPLTIQDFTNKLGKADSKLLWENLIETFKFVKTCYRKKMIEKNQEIHGIKFNIYGVDIAPDENLNTQVIEINKGPDLSYKDERDKQVKLNLVIDCLTLVKLIKNGDPTNFIKV